MTLPSRDQVTQANVIALLETVEDGGVFYAEQLHEEYPVLCQYMARHGWLAPMGNGVARSTIQGEALRRFHALP